MTRDEVFHKAKELVNTYSSDLEDGFVEEFLLFSRMYEDKKSVVDMIRAPIDDKLITSFPNVNIAFRISLSIFGTSAEGERSFSKMKLIKIISDQQRGSNDCRHFHYFQLKMTLYDNCHSTR
jgi:hypothetical protein